jgi:hypothetical protein
MYNVSQRRSDSVICTIALNGDTSGTLGACYQLTYDLLSQIQLQRIIKRAHDANSCIKFHAPWNPRFGGFLIQSVDTYNGPYCHEY